MSQHKKYQPRHAAPRPATLGATPKRVLTTTVLASGVAAVGVTGVSVGGGVLAAGDSSEQVRLSAGEVDLTSMADAVATAADGTQDTDTTAAEALANRAPIVSRSDRRAAADPTKEALLSTEAGLTTAREENLDDSDPRDIARALMPGFGFSADQFGCLDNIWSQESGWRVDADNPTSSAYGIPQALTASRTMPEGYFTSAEVQIRWGLEYIAGRYGTPCNAWGFKRGHGWY